MGREKPELGAKERPFDIFIIGGGVNGCGVARDAAGRGYKVGLAEMNDLASGTSSKSTKLIHGGLRYLESRQFRLVREALAEREVLLRMAPHLVRPLRFVLPVQKGMRPAWLLRLGLFLYDHLGGRETLPATTTLDLTRAGAGKPLKPHFAKGFEYSDCRVDDARLVVLNARDAADRGAVILPRTQVVSARGADAVWRVALRDGTTGAETEIFTRLLVNAAGPWVEEIVAEVCAQNSPRRLRLVRGSHIVVARIFDHDGAYIFQNPDGRVVFAIAYEGDYTLIGTTDVDFSGAPDKVAITPEEIDYLCRAASAHFVRRVETADVVWAFSGLRALVGDSASAAHRATRETVVEERRIGGAPLINVYGGKITGYRRLAEKILQRIGAAIGPRGESWTARTPLPGGDFPGGDLARFVRTLRAQKPFLAPSLAWRLARAYGTLCLGFLEPARRMADLGEDFGGGLTRAEVDYLVEREWARTPEDILWRRSKLGLRALESETGKLAAYFAARQRKSDARTSRENPQ